MAEVTFEQLKKILLQVTYRTYVEALIKNTPGKGIVGSEWEVELRQEGLVIYNEQYGDIIKYLEEGTAPHIIRAKTSKALAFGWPNAPFPANGKGGEHVFKKVKHPGIEARRFVQKVMEDRTLKKEWSTLFSKELEKLIAKQV